MEPFIVEEIVEDRSPRSIMQDGTKSFAKHYETEYGCKVIDLDQPLQRISNAEKHHFMYAPWHKELESTKHKELNRDKFLSKRTLLGSKYLGFYSSRSLKMRERYISFAQFVTNCLYIFERSVFTF